MLHILLTPFAFCALVPIALGNPTGWLEGPASQRQTLQDCLAARGVPTALNTSPDWASLTTNWNLRLQYTPASVTLPNTVQHVSDSIMCAVAAGVKVQPRSGGHSFGSYSLGGKDGSLIVDLQKFNAISLDKLSGIVTVGGGVRLGNLGLEIFNQGKRALPHGTFPGVGIGGHYTHGGFGFFSRRWGYALDTIVAMDVVLANGSYIHSTSTSYPDIYYALRGAADSFGIVTTFHLQTQPALSQVVSFSANFASAFKSANTAAKVVLQLQTFVTSSPYMDRNFSLEIYMNSNRDFNIRGWYLGDLDYFAGTMFLAMLNGLPTPDNSTIQYRTWLEALEDIAEGEPLVQPLTGYNNHQTIYCKSVVTRESQLLTKAALESYFAYVINVGLTTTFLWENRIELYGGKDSQVNEPSADSAAFSQRDSLWVFNNLGSTSDFLPPFSPKIITFVNGLNTALTSAQPSGDFLAYPNYVDPELTLTDAAQLYYGASTYNKLVSIKKVVDSESVFWNPQAIGNAVLQS